MIAFVVIVVSAAFTFGYFYELKYSIPGILATVVTSIYLVFGLIRAKGLLEIDYYGSAVVKVQRGILTVKRKALKHRKYELILLPMMALPLIPILFKLIHNIDIYTDTILLSIEVIVILGISYPLVFWLYKYFYDNKFKNAENLLAQLDKFEKEDEYL